MGVNTCFYICTETLLLATHFQTPWTPRDIWSDLTKFWGPTVGNLTKNSSEKSNAPHIPGVLPPSGFTLIECVISALFLGNMLRARKYRFAMCFRVLSSQHVERSAYANVFKFNRENKRFERAKVNSRCFHWFRSPCWSPTWEPPPTWRLHTKPYNFQWNILPNNYSWEYRTSPKLWHVVYLLLFYDISISWLHIFNGKKFYFSLAW